MSEVALAFVGLTNSHDKKQKPRKGPSPGLTQFMALATNYMAASQRVSIGLHCFHFHSTLLRVSSRAKKSFPVDEELKAVNFD
jgi:hypothetical protein